MSAVMVRRLSTRALAASALLLTACDPITPTNNRNRDFVQTGERGTSMAQIYNRDANAAKFKAVSIPTTLPPAGLSPPGPLPWKNVQVLNDISVAEFNRTMIAFSTWVAGTGNCAYCHNVANFASDTLNNGKPIYTKLTARRMIQMTRHINGNYASHVANTGVTCYTCHLGKPQPNGLWFYSNESQYLRNYLDYTGARVVSHTVAPSPANRSSVKQTENTYAQMISMSTALGVNCTYCHNSRQFASWEQSPPARVKAYRGIQMIRDVNSNYVAPLASILPAIRLGPMGDGPKAQCSTCHNGVYKPLYGAQMAKDYPAVWGRTEWNGIAFPGLHPGTDTTKAKVASAAAPATPIAAAGAGSTGH